MTHITEIGTYSFRSTYGNKHVRMATFVKFSDGQVIRFMEKLSNKEAVRNAEYQVSLRERGNAKTNRIQ